MAERHNNHIQVFTAEGQFLRAFGKHGQGRGELTNPSGLTIDTDDVVYVSEGSDNYHVSVFTSEGQYLTSFGRRGKDLGEFNWPCGLAVDSNGFVYVCDYFNNRIQVF